MRSSLPYIAVLLVGGLCAGLGGPAAHAQAVDDSTYTVRQGDTLYRIARRTGVSVEQIQRWNALDGTSLEAGQVLRVRPPSDAENDETGNATYTVRRGDTLFSIAQRFGVSVRALQAWNDLPGTAIEVGQTLRVRPPTPPPDRVEADPEPTRDSMPPADTMTRATAPDTARAADTTRTPASAAEPPVYGRYTPSTGDSFVQLALRIGTTADTLFALNDSTTAPLSADRTVRLPKRFAPPTHVASEGETIYDVAGTYGVSARALREVNRIDTTALRPGQRLRLPGRDAPEIPARGIAAPDTTGPLAVYPSTYAGRLMSSGASYDPETFVGAHPSLPYGSLVLLTNPATGQHTFVRIADRGPLNESFLMDVSAAAARQLNLPSDPGNQPVELRVVWANR